MDRKKDSKLSNIQPRAIQRYNFLHSFLGLCCPYSPYLLFIVYKQNMSINTFYSQQQSLTRTCFIIEKVKESLLSRENKIKTLCQLFTYHKSHGHNSLLSLCLCVREIRSELSSCVAGFMPCRAPVTPPCGAPSSPAGDDFLSSLLSLPRFLFSFSSFFRQRYEFFLLRIPARLGI